MSHTRELPPKYYRDHFLEFLSYIQDICGHLLDDSDQQFLSIVNALNDDALCLFVRLVNRKADFVNVARLQYHEIEDLPGALTQLHAHELVQGVKPERLSSENWIELLNTLTKPELMTLARALPLDPPPPPVSAQKARWVEWLRPLQADVSSDHGVLENYVQECEPAFLQYFKYLFFGNLRGTLNQFSMRDLGLLRTRDEFVPDEGGSARFDTLGEAKSAFFYAEKLNWLKRAVHSIEQLKYQADMAANWPEPSGPVARDLHGKWCYELGRKLLEDDEATALRLLHQSSDPRATEKYIRVRYLAGCKEEVEGILQNIIENPESEHLLLFAQDFLERKYQQKRTSLLTDMLRDAPAPLPLDEAYRDRAEAGVKAFLQRKGATAWHTENRVWLCLFGLTFWEELFGADHGLCTPFDRRPTILTHNQFYTQSKTAIESRLSSLAGPQMSPANWIAHIRKVATRAYGKPNGIFRWHPALLDILTTLIAHSSLESLAQLMRDMAQDFNGRNDGYPDLMVLEGERLRFEEVKAPGDVLRRNQLARIRRLRELGFEVLIRRVEWQLDPNQPYVVVDVETTGGGQSYHRVIEIGMVKVVGGEIVDNWQSLIHPERHIPRHITELTGISNDMVANAPTFAEKSDEILAFLQDAIFVAHNVNFDYGFFKREFERVGTFFRLPKLCTVRLARAAFPGLPSYSLGKLCKSLDIRLESHHRALDDAQAAAEILRLVQEAVFRHTGPISE